MQKKMWRLCLYTRRVQVLAVCIVPVPPPTEDVISCTYKQWFKPIVRVGGIVSLLILGGAFSAFYTSDRFVMACQLLLAVWLVLAM